MPKATRSDPVRGGTLFSGIGAPECAAPEIDWRWAAEIDPFASSVHVARFPNVPNLGDVTEIDPGAVEAVELIVFGSPCQSFSVAGKRLGLDDPRGNLALIALRLVGRIRPRWMVFENVPGLLSSDEGRDFGAFLGLLGECGYGFAYRILDAQFAGVPQRRRRVFVVGYLGDWRPAAAVLFEPESLRGDPAPRREPGERPTGPVTACAGTERKHGHGWGQQEFESGFVQPVAFVAHSLRADGFDASEDGTGRGTPLVPVQCNGSNVGLDLPSLRRGNGHVTGGVPAVAFQSKASASNSMNPSTISPGLGVGKADGLAVAFESRFARNGRGAPSDFVPPLKAQSGQTGKGDAAPLVAFQTSQSGVRIGDQHATLGGNNGSRRHHGALSGMSVRRLTPRECERLQGFPDDFTLIQHRGKPAADGPRYRALGNSMAVPVLRWIVSRILTADQLRELP